MLAGFAADGEAAGNVGARGEAALDGIANGHIFVLNLFADGDAFAMVLRGGRAGVHEIIIKNDGALVNGEREDEVGIHHAGIGVDHEIRIDPKIECVTLARGADGRIESAGGIERAGLQASALEILDGVLGVLDDTAEPFVGVGNVVTAVEIIVHVDFPVAVQRVDPAIEVVELFGELERRDEFGNFAEKFPEGSGSAIEIDEDEIFPNVYAHGNKAVIGAIEIADALELDHALQDAIVAVGPAMIGAAELFGTTVGFENDGGGVMAADVVKGAEFAIIAPDYDERFFVDVNGEELAGILDVIEVADDLPVGSEDGVTLELRDAGIEIPGSGNGPGVFERVGGIVEIEDVANAALVHERRLRD